MEGLPGLSIVGTVYTDALRSISKVLFDKRETDTLTEYISGPKASGRNGILDAVYTTAEHMSVGTGTLLPSIFIAQPTPGAAGLFKPATPVAQQQPQRSGEKIPPPQGPKQDEQSYPALWICLAGVVGGMGRELMRWKSLSDRKRADLFRKPQYFVISLIQLGLAASVALIFTQVVSGNWKYVVAFVSGAGLEELIRLAMKLEIWTPAVPHGSEEMRPSIAEYLRA